MKRNTFIRIFVPFKPTDQQYNVQTSWVLRIVQTRPAQVVGRGVDKDAVDAQEAAKGMHGRILSAAEEKRKKINCIIK